MLAAATVDADKTALAVRLALTGIAEPLGHDASAIRAGVGRPAVRISTTGIQAGCSVLSHVWLAGRASR
jgi:hypothetical protein